VSGGERAASQTPAPPIPATGAILSTDTLALPAFANLPAVSQRISTEADYERARGDSRCQMVRITYLSDGLPVVAFVYRSTATAGQRPVIVYNRGSYIRQNAAPELLVKTACTPHSFRNRTLRTA
jgi:hypothetical protein